MGRKETVTRVINGDTFMNGYRKRPICLANVNTLEKGALGTEAATQALRQLMEGATVSITTVARDKYGRSVANVKTGNHSINADMRRKGYK